MSEKPSDAKARAQAMMLDAAQWAAAHGAPTTPVILYRPGPAGQRRYVLDADLTPLSVVDDFGPLRGATRFDPPAEWTPEDVLQEAAELAMMASEPRRKKR